MDLEQRGGWKEHGDVWGWKTVVRIYCIGK